MSQQLISRSADLRKLRDDGYEIDILAGHLVVRNVPYVNSRREVRRGYLVSTLNLAGDVTASPGTHVATFAGEHPCDKNGIELHKIKHQSVRTDLGEGLAIDHSFSSKPQGGYTDYYHKMDTYASIISCHAEAIDSSATARTGRVIEATEPESPFHYIDTASSRAGIVAVADKLRLTKVGIVGLGGTGSYILDLVAKTPVKEINIFDGDRFFQHNAFRSPGAPSIEELRENPLKVQHFKERYSRMHKNIVAHDMHIEASNADVFRGMDFVFLCVDVGSARQVMVQKLEELEVPFIDVGMGIDLSGDSLRGILRVTTSTPEMRDHVRAKQRIPFSGEGVDNAYSKNIQIADLNALNAALAVIKWKKLFGFYADLDGEHYSAYTIDGNALLNEDQL